MFIATDRIDIEPCVQSSPLGLCSLLSLICVCLIAAFSPTSVLGQADSSKAKAERMVREIAARELVFSAVESISECPIAQEDIVDNLLKSPSKYRTAQAGRSGLRALYEQQIRDDLKTKERAIYDHVNSETEWVSLDWVKERLRDQSAEINGAITEVTGDSFLRVYNMARQEAVLRQWQEKDVREILPTVDEIEDLHRGATQKEEIVERLARDAEAKVNLFEENEPVLLKEIRRRIDCGREQLQHQLGILDNSQAGRAVTTRAISAELRADIRDYVSDWQMSSTQQCEAYAMFPMVESQIPVKARERMIAKFSAFVRSEDLCSPLDVRKVTDAKSQALLNLREFDKSLASIQQRVRPDVAKTVVSSYLQRSDLETDDSFRRTLRELVASETSVRGVLDASLRKCLKEALKHARNALSDSQLAADFPHIADRTWEVPEDTIKKFTEDILKARGVTTAMLTSKRNRVFLEETEKKLSRGIDALLKEAERAFSAQGRIVESIGKVIEDSTKNWDDSTAVFDYYRNAVMKEWSNRRTGEDKTKYLSLFQTTEEEIWEEITKFFDPPKRQTPETPFVNEREPGGDSTGGSGGQGNGGSGGGGGAHGGDPCAEYKVEILRLDNEFAELNNEFAGLKEELEQSENRRSLFFWLAVLFAGLALWGWWPRMLTLLRHFHGKH